MSVNHLRLLWLWAGILAVLLCLLFLPLATGGRILAVALILTAVIVALIVAGRKGEWGLTEDAWLDDIPDAPYRLPVVLVCGDIARWPECGVVLRTAQGCWLNVPTAELQQTVRTLLRKRPDLISQLAVMVCVCPQLHGDEAALAVGLNELRWQLNQARSDCRRSVPLLLSSHVAGASVPHSLWQTAQTGEAMQVWQANDAPCCTGTWLAQKNGRERLATQVRMNALVRLTHETALAMLTAPSVDTPPVIPAMMLYHMTPSGAPVLPQNLWQRWLSHHTALGSLPGWQPDTSSADVLLPDFILPLLPLGVSETPRARILRRAFCLFTLAILIALCASAWNNRQLLQRVGFDIQHYEQIAMVDYASKARALQILSGDAVQLDQWARRGEPLNLSLGLYHGAYLRIPVLAAIRSWEPPPPPQKPAQKTVPKTIRLDSMSLFDTGRWALKPGSTKLLVHSLVGIKAKPGWLIVVAGHTDSTGEEKANQILSLKRAESVRDWMRDTGDVPESCFAVQGFGENRPVATNETVEGRALNRRVEISLVPQVNACQPPGMPSALSRESGASINETEK
ncbi:TPA: OmpA family protein [Klebsiella oxytoca]|uniref:OmpA family protein n=1 Tax=Klebsiella TaxID=570 RepID=UPI0018C459C1|nr:OmpA family protein [Klebsiella oxytoca]ELT8150577.1 OmpA family protein [Klebsiella oxytoca]ELT9463226.1 OmpA family protein [Klebsiella oxytoca]EME8414913.1 OmpA family protein [Klebsiella oxytoca]MBG2577649.1 OmpA family protein [Klebsiella oxytoca]MDK6511951.1 OmpA family protein [Klebsiella oxytoca]